MNPIHSKTRMFALLFAFGLSACTQQIESADNVDTAAPDDKAKREAVAAQAADKAPDATVRAALKRLDPTINPDYIGPAAVPGYQEVIIKGTVVFVSNDGRYVARNFMDLSNDRDIAMSGALPGWRLQALNEIPASERIVFAPAGASKHTVTVFTDVECGYCRKLHQDIGEYNKLGIAIEYIAFPRAGMGTPDAMKLESVWCSSDRRKALTDAKNDGALPALKCDNPVAKHLEIGKRIGLEGTPMIINANGIALSGYLTPVEMLESLEKLAAQQKS